METSPPYCYTIVLFFFFPLPESRGAARQAAADAAAQAAAEARSEARAAQAALAQAAADAVAGVSSPDKRLPGADVMMTGAPMQPGSAASSASAASTSLQVHSPVSTQLVNRTPTCSHSEQSCQVDAGGNQASAPDM